MELKKSLAEIMDLSQGELIMWRKYYSEMPFGYYRQEAREAYNCQAITAPHIKNKVDLDVFMLFKKPKKELTAEQLANKINSIFGGTK